MIIIGVKQFANMVDLQRIDNNYKNKKMELDKKMQFILTRDDADLILEGWD